MLEILLLIAVGRGFYGLAKKKGLNAVLYAVLSIVFWFGFMFIGMMILGMIDPYALDEMGSLLLYGYSGAIIGIGLLYFILINAAKAKEAKEMKGVEELVDGGDTFDI
ncbi:MAG: hypothetical protein R2780_07515 [Crocinitomicaceae bacterium]|nr:hypothetical protein [Crocinitomicaceae bacterium]